MEQRNNVRGGMYIDCDPIDQPKETYRNSFNGEIFEAGENRFVWRSKKGNQLSFSITENMIPSGAITLLDKVVFTSCGASNECEIGYVLFDELNGYEYFPIYFHPDLNFDLDHLVKGKGIVENETTERIYFFDHKNLPRVLNIKEITTGNDSSPYFSTCELGVKYLLVSGGNFSYKNIYGSTAIAQKGDVIEFGTGANLNVDPLVHKIVKYIPADLLSWTPEALPSVFKFKKIIPGHLLYGSYFLTYRFGLNSGYNTPWQKIIGPIPVINIAQNILSGVPSTTKWKDYHDTVGDSHVIGSLMGLQLELTSIDGKYDYVEIAYLHATEKDVAISGYITIKEEIAGRTSIVVDFIENIKYANISVSDIIIKNISIEDINDLDILKDKMNIAGVIESSEIRIGQKIEGSTIRSEIYEYCFDHAGLPSTATSEPEKPLNSASQDNYGTKITIQPGQRYRVSGTGPSSKVSYNSVTYTSGQVFVGIVNVYGWNSLLGGFPKPVVAVRKYFDRGTIFGGPAPHSVFDYYDLDLFYDYKDPMMAYAGKGYWGNQRYRFALIAFDKYLNPLFARFLNDFLTPDRLNTLTTKNGVTSTGQISEYNSITGITNGEDVSLELLRAYHDTNVSKYIYNGKILSMVIDDLDLTDIIDDISAFSIVRCEREKTIISEGYLEPIVKRTVYDQPENANRRCRSSQLVYRSETGQSIRHHNWYCLIDPSKLFGKDDSANINEGDRIKISRYLQSKEAYEEGYANFYTKYYLDNNGSNYFPSGASPIGTSVKVKNAVNVPMDRNLKTYLTPDEPNAFFQNIGGVLERSESEGDISITKIGGKCTIIETEEDGGTYGLGYWNEGETDYTTQMIPIIQHIKSKSDNYNGSTGFAIAGSQFIFINHFQIVDADFKQAIKKTVNGIERYIVSGIQLFGGDCFINVFDYKRTYIDYYSRDNYSAPDEPYYSNSFLNMSTKELYYQSLIGQSVFIALQSDINLALKIGNHVGKMRSAGHFPAYPNENPLGLQYADQHTWVESRGRWEDYMYDDSYSSEHCEIKYPAAPVDIDMSNSFMTRIRYSIKKLENELIDSFRIFRAADRVELNKHGGKVNVIFGEKDRLFYWQDLICGYIPVGERAMTTSDMGVPVQMGLGGSYDRVDDITKFVGAQHRFGVVKTPEGFVWYDAIRKLWVHMDYGTGLTEDSLVAGMSNLFYEFSDKLAYKDNLLNYSGVAMMYSPSENTVYGLFYVDNNDAISVHVISYNTKIKKYISRHGFMPTVFATINNMLISSASSNQFFKHDAGPLRTFYGQRNESFVQFIVNQNEENIKDFLYATLISSLHFFHSVIYETDNQMIQEIVSSNSDYYESRMGYLWKFNFPLPNDCRLYGLYLSIKLMNDLDTDNDGQVNQLLTEYTEWL